MPRKLVWVLALIMAAFSSLLVYRAMEGSARKAKANAIPTDKVMVAIVVIPARTIIKPEWVEMKAIPVNAIPADAARLPKDVIGKITKSDVLPGETIRKQRLLAEGERLGLPFMIPAGFRGMAVPVDEATGVAGFIKPGDIVDVLVTLEDDLFDQRITATLLQGIQVLAVAQDMEAPADEKLAKKGKVATSVTLAVDPMQAERLTLAMESGKIRLVLRPLNSGDTAVVEPINPLMLVEGKLPAFPNKKNVVEKNTTSSSDNGSKNTKPASKKTTTAKPTNTPTSSTSPVEKPQKKVEVILGEKTVNVNVE